MTLQYKEAVVSSVRTNLSVVGDTQSLVNSITSGKEGHINWKLSLWTAKVIAFCVERIRPLPNIVLELPRVSVS